MTLQNLEGITTGMFEITTSSGTHHILDLDHRAVTRYGAPGQEWTWDNPNSIAGLDGDPFYYDHLNGPVVGSRMYMEYRGSYMESDKWKLTTTVVSIEPYVSRETIQSCEEYGNDDATEGRRLCLDCLENEAPLLRKYPKIFRR